jgi:hypothetical protein
MSVASKRAGRVGAVALGAGLISLAVLVLPAAGRGRRSPEEWRHRLPEQPHRALGHLFHHPEWVADSSAGAYA